MIIGKQIKAILFDLGKVLINVDESKTVRAFQELGLKDVDKVWTGSWQHPIFYRIEQEEMNFEDFKAAAEEIVGSSFSDDDFEHAWNAMLGEIPQARLDLLDSLSEDYDLYLLSNTNTFHIQEIYRLQERRYGKEKLFPQMVKELYSYRLGCRKPDSQVFEQVIREIGYAPNEILYIDDGKEHIDAAKKFGIDGVLLEGEVVDLFE